MALTIVFELDALIKKFFTCTDSRISLFWSLNMCDRQLELFLANREQSIKSLLNLAVEQLATEYRSLEIKSNIAKQKATTQSYQDVLFWVPGTLNTADQETTFKTYSDTGFRHRMIMAEECRGYNRV